MKSGVMVEKQYLVMSYAICYATGTLTGTVCNVHIYTFAHKIHIIIHPVIMFYGLPIESL